MSASKLMEAAAGDAVRMQNHLSRCRQYANDLGFDDRVLLEVQAAHALEQSFRALAAQLATAELRRKVATRRQGRAS
ncbi:MAG TPA: hypothetical protein VGE37_12760 [Archangium sp.]